jgi:hypothetical protein
MHESFAAVEGEFGFATYTDGQDVETIQSFLEESIKASCEGLMVKMLDGDESGYEPSKRSRNWLKVCMQIFITYTYSNSSTGQEGLFGRRRGLSGLGRHWWLPWAW